MEREISFELFNMQRVELPENVETELGNLIEKLRQNLHDLLAAEQNSLSQASLPETHGVYVLFFQEKMQYAGSSGNLSNRIKKNLLGGNRNSHTLINKLCTLRKKEAPDAVRWLKNNSNIKFTVTQKEEDAKILEDVLIAIYHPHFNTPLRTLKKLAVHG